MSWFPLLRGLKIVKWRFGNGISRRSLIEPTVEAARIVSSTGKRLTSRLEGGKRNISIGYHSQSTIGCHNGISRYEWLRKKLPAINGERTLHANEREGRGETKKYVERRAFLLDSGSSNILLPPLAPIYHTWKFSKELCPSRGYHSPSMKKLPNSMLKFYSSGGSPSSRNFSCEKSKKAKDSCMTKYRSKNIRSYSSCKDSDNKTRESDKCGMTTTAEESPQNCGQRFDKCAEESSQNCSEKVDKCADECSTTSRSCPPSFKDIPVECTKPPCPNINDYCPSVEESYKVKFWQLLSILSIPVIILMSGHVYTRELEKAKEPRPEFVDLPYLRRVVKAFPWGDGKHTLFHNPRKNPISPDGYEVEDPNAPLPKKVED